MVGLGGTLAAPSGRAAAAITKDRRLILFDFISENYSAFHYKFHALHFGDIR